ncbi:uncharacterized protein [Coffea arabica]
MRLRYDSLFVVDPIGRAGGLAIIWRKDLVVKRVLFIDFTIELNVEGKGTEEDWWFVGIYASSSDQLREQQWKTIEHRTNIWGRNWILASDMNDLLSSGEKWEGKQRSDRSFRIFRNFVNNNQLIDIEFEGIPWTWCNNWDEEGEVVFEPYRQQADKKGRLSALKRQLTEAYKKEEAYWGQKARVQWLKERDRNTKYFHTVVAGRRRRNNISTLQREDGTWCKSEGEVEGEINGYFRKLFTSTNPRQFDAILNGIPQVITGQMNNKLTRPVSEMEVRKAMFSLHPNKAPGSDDMVKAYDSVEWPFVVKMLEKMGFCQLWINWIFKCMSSVVYSFNVNGEKKGMVRPSRGIRQGDPLSPYLFVLVSEGLASLKEARQVMRILEIYEIASRQKINTDKSSVFFSKNTDESKKAAILGLLGGMKHVDQSRHLGLPMVIGKSKRQVFNYIKVKVLEKLKGWKEKLLSQAGKEVLLKSVA